MSHFTVLVIGPNPEKQLAPYSEEKKVKRYKYHLDADAVRRMRDHYEKELGRKITTKDLVAHMKGWEGADGGNDKKGLFCWSTRNPKSKWNWYTLGGRWTGFFKLRQGATGKSGLPGSDTRPAEDGWCDQARKGDVDFEATIAKRIAQGKASWESAKGKDVSMRFFAYGIDKNDTEESFLKKHQAWRTHAVVKSGKWYEKGNMGWWGVVVDEKDPDAWQQEFSRLIAGLPPSTLLSVYDCHI